MFEKPFSFEGRIRRTEYGLSMIISGILNFIAQAIAVAGEDAGGFIFLVLLIPILWFTWAQGAKRCHDLGNSGWYQIIPFYGLWLLFQDGKIGPNKYGENPKQVNQASNSAYQSSNSSGSPKTSYNNTSGYSGGYSGGHNNHPGSNANQAFKPQNHPSNSESDNSEYKSGNLYN